MSPWRVVWRKELRDAARDRRALLSLLIFPFIGPLMVYFMLQLIIDLGEEARDQSLPVIGADQAPDLLDYLRQNGVLVQPLSEVPTTPQVGTDAWIRQAIAQRSYDYVLVVPPDFQARIVAFETVNVELHYDSSRTSIAPRVGRIQSLIDGWGQETAVLRLMVQGLPPSLLRPVAVSRIDVATGQARALAIIGMIPLFVVLAAFMTGAGIAVDTTAGERERKSLEPLLVNPVSRLQLVVGKWLVATAFAIGGLVLVMGLSLLALSLVPLEQIGISFVAGPWEIANILLVTIPLGFFATSLQIFVGLFARSFKDAQVYIMLMSFLPTLPYLYNILNTTGREFWMSLVPMLGQNMLLSDVFSGRMPAWVDLLVAGVCLLLWSLLFIVLAARQLSRERILLG